MNRPGRARLLPLVAAAAALALSSLDAYAVAGVLPAMLYDLDLAVNRVEQATPVVSGFLAGYVVVMPLVGIAADRAGRRLALLAALILFALGSAVTASAGYTGEPPYGWTGLPWLVAGRILQGLGGGALVPVALALAADAFPPGRRDLAIGLMSGVQEAGSVLGPLYAVGVAGLDLAGSGWRAVFWLNLPAVALLLALAVAAWRWAAAGPPGGRSATAGAPVDWTGAALLGAGVALAAVALYPDRPGQAAVNTWFWPAGAGALAALAGWAWRERQALSPVIPRRLLAGRAFLAGAAANLLTGAGLMIALVDVPVLARGVFSLDQRGAALLLARFMIAVPVGAVLGGWLAGRVSRMGTAVGGLALAGGAYVLMAGWGQQELERHLAGLGEADLVLAAAGLGFGLVIAPLATVVIDRADASHHALAASLVVLTRTLGMLLGLTALSAYGLDRFYALFRAGTQVVLVPGSPDFAAQKHAYEAQVTAALVAEYHGIFWAAAGLCAVAAALALIALAGARSAASRAGSTTLSR